MTAWASNNTFSICLASGLSLRFSAEYNVAGHVGHQQLLQAADFLATVLAVLPPVTPVSYTHLTLPTNTVTWCWRRGGGE